MLKFVNVRPRDQERKEHLRAALRGLSMRLRASLGASSVLSDSLTKGELREEDIVAAFRPFVPHRYDIVKGIVISPDGDESDPQDIIIYDTSVVPTVLGAGNTRVVPIEGVVAVIQVKSNASKENIAGAVANLASAKTLLPRQPRYAPSSREPGWQETDASFFAGALFLGSSLRPETVAARYGEESMKRDPRGRCDAIVVVDQLAILWGDPSAQPPGLHFAFRGEQAEAPLWLQGGEDSLLFFYLSFMEHLRHWIAPSIDWLDYVFGRDRRGTTLAFQYSYWYDDDQPPPPWAADYQSSS